MSWGVWIGLLALIGFIGSIDMPAMFWPGDPNIWREESRSILAHGRLAIDPAVIPFAGPPGQTLIRNPRNELMYSKYGLMNSIMSLIPMWIDRQFLGGSMVPVTNPNLIVFNIWNIALSLVLASVLMKISGLYTSRYAARVIFVLTIFYGTYLWYYLRAQSSEIYQVIFYATAYLFLITFCRNLQANKFQRWRLYIVWAGVAALVFTRISYILLIPLAVVFVLVTVMRIKREERYSIIKKLWPHLLCPSIVIVVLLCWVNYIKFGAPWLTGYHVWNAQAHLPTVRIDKGLWGLLVMPQYNVFLYFPLAAFALLGIREFARRFFIDAVVIFGTAITFLLFFSSLPQWSGEWTYGPRYLLFALPIFSLPFLLVIERILDRPRSLINLTLAGVFGVLLAYSGYLQFRVNSVRYFAFQEIRRNLEDGWPEPVRAYIQDHHVGITIDDLLRHRDRFDDTLLFVQLKERASPQVAEQIRRIIREQCLPMNHYWLQRN